MSLRLEILAALFGDFETIYTMRNCRAMKPYGLALVGKNVLVAAVRDLLNDRDRVRSM
jgi:hypothetical protein